MSRVKAGTAPKATPRTSTRSSNRKFASLLSSEANDTPVVGTGRRRAQDSPAMRRADETMLYDIAPPPDMPSSSLFGDESDEDMDSSPRPANGNAVKGKGNLLTPMNSELITAPSQPLPSARLSVRLPSPESMPQNVAVSQLNASQSRRRTATPKPSSAPTARTNIIASTPTATSQSQPVSGSARRQVATPNNASRHATPPRPLVAETAYFRRTLTPIARKALKGKAVGCMEKPIDFEGEDPLLLEPELRHRSGSMTPGTITRSKRIPRTAPVGKNSRTSLKAPPATSAAQRLFVRPDGDYPVASPKAPEDDDDDEAGNDTFVEVKKRRQPPQRSALGSQPPLNASDLKSSDPVNEGDHNSSPRRPSPLLDLGRFVGRQSLNGTQELRGSPPEHADPEPSWNEPLFFPASPDSSNGSPPPVRSPSPVQIHHKEEPASPTRSASPNESLALPPSSPPRQPSPVASLRSSPALHAPTPALGLSSPIRRPPSPPAVVPSPVIPPSPALRAPTPGVANPSPHKPRDSLRKSVQTKSQSGKRLSESLRSPSRELSEPHSQRSSQRSRPYSRLQSPFGGMALSSTPKAPARKTTTAEPEGAAAEAEEDFSLEGDTMIVADEEDSVELEETYINTQPEEEAGLAPAAEPNVNRERPNGDTLRHLRSDRRLSTSPPSSSPAQRLSATHEKGMAHGSEQKNKDDNVRAAGTEPSAPRQLVIIECPASAQRDASSQHTPRGAAEERSQAKSTTKKARASTAEDPLLLEPPPRSVTKPSASQTRQSWLDRVRARSTTPASPLGQKKGNEPVSSLDRFLAFSPVPEPARPVPSSTVQEADAEANARLRFSLSPSMARAWQPHTGQESRPPSSPPRMDPLEPTHGFDAGLEKTVELPSLVTSAADLDSPHAEGEPFDFSAGVSFSDDGEYDDEPNAEPPAERHEELAEAQTVDAEEASFDLSAETVCNGDESFTALPDEAEAEHEEEEACLQRPEELEAQRHEDSKVSSRSPYVSDDSPLADVVNAALDAGMVIEASSTAEEVEVQTTVEEMELQTSAEGIEVQTTAEEMELQTTAVEMEQQQQPTTEVTEVRTTAVTPPQLPAHEKESSPEQESDEEPVMAPRLRRSLHAGATPRRPNMQPAKVAPPPKPASPPSLSRPQTPVRSERPQVFEPTVRSERPPASDHSLRSPASSQAPPTAPASSPLVRDHSSPFMARRSVSPPAPAARSSGGRTTRSPRTRPEIVVEPSSPLVPSQAGQPKGTSPISGFQRNASPNVGPNATPSPIVGGPHTRPSSASVASLDRTPSRQEQSVTPTPQPSAGKTKAAPAQEPASAQRTDRTPIVAPSPRVIKPLPTRGASVTPRASLRPGLTLFNTQSPSRSSTGATPRPRSKSPLRSFSPRAIGTTTAIAATALAVAVPAAASPSPATVRAQLSPEPEAPHLASSAVSPSQSPGPFLDAYLYRSPPRSTRSSHLSLTPSAHSTHSARSRSPCASASGSDHISLANSRLALALAGLSDDDEDSLPSPPKISFTSLSRRSHERTPQPETSLRSPPASVSRKRAPSHTSVSGSDVQATPKPTEKASTTAVETDRTELEAVPSDHAAVQSEPEEEPEEHDIGADETVVHDIGADDTVDAGSAWDLTAAEFTFDGEMSAFGGHAFKGPDWDATRIERVARGRSEGLQLQDINEQANEDTTTQQPETAVTNGKALEASRERKVTQPVTPPRAPSAPRSPARQSPRLAARKDADTPSRLPPPARRPKTPTPAPASPARSSPRLAVKRPEPTPASPLRSAVKTADETHAAETTRKEPAHLVALEDTEAEHLRQQEEDNGAGEEHGPADDGAAAEDNEPEAVPNHKVTLKVVTRIVKVEDDSEDEVDEAAPGRVAPSSASPRGGKASPRNIASVVTPVEAQHEASDRPAPPSPPPPPPAPPPRNVAPQQSTTAAATEQQHAPAATEQQHAPAVASAPTKPPTAPASHPTPSAKAKGGTIIAGLRPVPATGSKIPLASTGRHTVPNVTTPAPTAPPREAQSKRTNVLDQPSAKPQISFVKEQSREIERALGRRPAVPSKLSKEVVPSSPAESPTAKEPFPRNASRASKDGPTSPTAAWKRRSDNVDSSFASSSSSSCLKRRFEDHFDDDDSERYASRASLHEELTAASDSDSDFDPEFPSMVSVSSVDPRAAARAAAILKMHHNWIENGILPDGSRVGTPKPHERSRARSVGALETPRTTGNRSTHATPHSRFFDSIESSRLISKEELLHEAELELIGPNSRHGTPFTADSPLRQIPGAWAATPRGRTPKRKRDSDEHEAPAHQAHQQQGLDTPFELQSRFNSSSYEGDVDGRSWTKRDWKYLEKTFRLLKARNSGSDLNFGAVVDAFLKQTGKEPVGEWSRDVLLLRVKALARRGKAEDTAEDRDAKRQKTSPPKNAPPSTLRKVMGWLWPSNSKPQTSTPSAAAAPVTKPKKLKRDDNFMRVRDESFDIGEVTMAATPIRRRDEPDQEADSPPFEGAHHAERSFEVDLERGNQSYDIPYDEEEEEDEDEFFLEPATYTARGERSSVTEASTSMYDHNTSTSSTRKIYPDLPNLHFPSRPHSLASSTKYVRNEEPRAAGSRLPVMGTPRPRARVRSDSSIADTSIASRPGSVRDMIRGFEESQELDLSFESARREREKDQLLGLRRVRSVVEKVKEQHQL